jgi:hypothetical protein
MISDNNKERDAIDIEKEKEQNNDNNNKRDEIDGQAWRNCATFSPR